MQIVIWICGVTLVGIAAGVVYQALGTLRDRKAHPAPGRLVDLGTHRLHMQESGVGKDGPTIVFESGLMSTVLSWTELQAKLSQSFRVVSYDRAGLGWSDLGPMPRTADRIADELHALLERAAIPGPYILVGHSFGGLTVPVFAARYPEEIAGVVLVDPVAPSEWETPSAHERKLTRIGARICRRAAFLARVGVIRFVAFLLTSPASRVAGKLVRLISRGAPANAGSVSSPWFLALPEREKEMARVFWIQPKFALTIASQLENLPFSARIASKSPIFSDKPVVILSAGAESEKRKKAHAEMAARLPRAIHITAKGSSHWIMQDASHLVVQAIEKVVEENAIHPVAGAAAD